jgi:hypothetical protein
MAPVHSVLKISHHFKPPVSQTHLYHSSVEGAPLPEYILKSLKSIEKSRHIRHLCDQLTGYITTREPLRIDPFENA